MWGTDSDGLKEIIDMPTRPVKRLAATWIATAALFAIGTAALAGPGGPRARHRGPMGGDGPDGPAAIERIAERLMLNDDQTARVLELFETHRVETRELRTTLREAREGLHAAVSAEAFDEAGVRDAAAAVASIEADLAVARATRLQGLREILTPEQFERLGDLRERRRERIDSARDERSPRARRGI